MTTALLDARARPAPAERSAEQVVEWPAVRARTQPRTRVAEPSLDVVITRLWRALEQGRSGACPICGDAISAHAGGGAAESRCGGCGSHLS